MKTRERLWITVTILALGVSTAVAQQSDSTGSQDVAQPAGAQQGSTRAGDSSALQGQQAPPPGLPGPVSRPNTGESKPQPVTPATAQPAGVNPSEEQQREQPSEEHTGPLGGVESAVAAAAGERSYILPTFSAAQDVDSNANFGPRGSGVQTVSILSAHVALNKLERRGQFVADYVGGGLIYENQGDLSGTFQQFGFSQDFQLRRWDLLLTDRVSYLPESAFGFGGIGLGSFGSGMSWGLGGGLNPVNPNFAPNQSVLSGQTGQFSNIAAVQGQYSFTPRTSVFATGAYDTLQFGNHQVSIGGQRFLSGNNEIFTGGFNQRLTSLDTVSFVYSHSQFNYVGSPTTVYNNLWQVGYGRRVTGRLSLNLFGGPEISTVRAFGVNLNRQVLFSGAARLEYSLPRTSLGLSYFQGASGGSGVVAGANTQTVYGDLDHRLTQTWTGSVTVGYAHNSALVTPAAGARTAYDSEYTSATLSRDFGRSLKFFLMYNLQREGSNQAFCGLGSACGTSFLRHVFGVGITYTRRPIGI